MLFAPGQKRSSYPRLHQAVTHVVVVAVAERLVEEPRLVQGLRAIRRVAGAHVVRPPLANRGVPLLEVHARDPGHDRSPRVGDEVALHGADARLQQRIEYRRRPARLQHDVLVDEANDRMSGLADALVHGGRRAPVRRAQHANLAGGGQPGQDRSRAVRAAVVHHDDFERTAVPLGQDGRQRLVEPLLAVVDRHDETDSSGVHGVSCRATTSR